MSPVPGPVLSAWRPPSTPPKRLPGSGSQPVPVLFEDLQDGLVSRLPEEAQQVVRPQPHAGGVGHGVEVDPLVASLHQVSVQDELHALVLVEEQSQSRGAALTHLRGDGGGKHVITGLL